MNNNTAISVTYSDSKLRILVEEYITMQKHDFTFKSLARMFSIEQWKRRKPQTLACMKAIS